jgi:hypothetical protein
MIRRSINQTSKPKYRPRAANFRTIDARACVTAGHGVKKFKYLSMMMQDGVEAYAYVYCMIKHLTQTDSVEARRGVKTIRGSRL